MGQPRFPQHLQMVRKRRVLDIKPGPVLDLRAGEQVWRGCEHPDAGKPPLVSEGTEYVSQVDVTGLRLVCCVDHKTSVILASASFDFHRIFRRIPNYSIDL